MLFFAKIYKKKIEKMQGAGISKLKLLKLLAGGSRGI